MGQISRIYLCQNLKYYTQFFKHGKYFAEAHVCLNFSIVLSNRPIGLNNEPIVLPIVHQQNQNLKCMLIKKRVLLSQFFMYIIDKFCVVKCNMFIENNSLTLVVQDQKMKM